jgi:hypothetical protein
MKKPSRVFSNERKVSFCSEYKNEVDFIDIYLKVYEGIAQIISG